MILVKDIYDFINKIAPYSTQEEWDNSGLKVGNINQEVKTVVMALDATNEVCNFAVDIGADLVLTHHPLMFVPTKQVLFNSPIYILANANISHLSAHTNFDIATNGINDNLAKILQLQNTTKLENGYVVLGDLENEMSIDDFAEFVAEKLDFAGIRYTDTEKMIKKVSVCGGAGGEFLPDATAQSDCYVTADLKYHEMLDAQQAGYAVISAGHYETENQAFLMLKPILENAFSDVEFVVAPYENPIKTVN
jgi:dinuclear metal center YbgI/SA1388 family protein